MKRRHKHKVFAGGATNKQFDRIEAKLDQLIDALAADYDDGDEDVLRSLDDGSAVGQARDPNQPL